MDTLSTGMRRQGASVRFSSANVRTIRWLLRSRIDRKFGTHRSKERVSKEMAEEEKKKTLNYNRATGDKTDACVCCRQGTNRRLVFAFQDEGAWRHFPLCDFCFDQVGRVWLAQQKQTILVS